MNCNIIIGFVIKIIVVVNIFINGIIEFYLGVNVYFVNLSLLESIWLINWW